MPPHPGYVRFHPPERSRNGEFWYDHVRHRRCFFHEGYWWWPHPYRAGVFLAFIGGLYYEYRSIDGGYTLIPEVVDPAAPLPQDPPPADAPPAEEVGPPPADAPPAPVEYYSADGNRVVRIDPTTQAAQLYSRGLDEAGQVVETYLADLGADVAEVRYRNDADGQVEQILVLPKAGDYRLYDRDGQPVPVPAPQPEPSGDGSSLPQPRDLSPENLGAAFDAIR